MLKINFIEFALEEKNLEQLENILIKLGFSEIGKHKSKSVKLFIFDDVKIILNYENTILVKEGRKQGPSPYAFGIKVNDIKSLLHNAKSHLKRTNVKKIIRCFLGRLGSCIAHRNINYSERLISR